jgi:hypothetical protein
MRDRGLGPQQVVFLDGQRVNVDRKEPIERERFGGLVEKLGKLPEEEREKFIEEQKLDKKLIEKLELPKKEDERFTIRKEDKSKRRGE